MVVLDSGLVVLLDRSIRSLVLLIVGGYRRPNGSRAITIFEELAQD